MKITAHVVTRDRRLEEAEVTAAEPLCKHRWHWTLDVSNEKRVPLREYARAVGRSLPVIRRDANGYAQYLEAQQQGETLTLSDARVLATMSADTGAAAKAVAKARGTSLKAARANPETKRVRQEAQSRAEQNGSSAKDEVDRIVVELTAAEKKMGEYWPPIRKHMDVARLSLFRVLTLTHAHSLKRQAQRALVEQTEALRNLLAMIDLAASGGLGVDWDEALARLQQAGADAPTVEQADADAMMEALWDKLRQGPVEAAA